jgi:SAM-dependent methyltransferase
MIDPKEVIAKYSVEEICAGAEHYFSSITDTRFHEKKPLSSPQDASELFYEVGLLLRGLKLGPSMRVLDLGAGTCWLSRFMNELGCRVTACDPSKTALEIGRRTIEKHPFTEPDKMEYQVFDGRTIGAPDRTFDRMVSFEAFHHMPNWEAILREIHRVLKPGGIAGFAEPGDRHSRSEMSQYEMRHFVVLENDIRLDEIIPVAEGMGFEFLGWEAVIKSRLRMDDYRTAVRDRWWSIRWWCLARSLLRAMRRTMGGRMVFFLAKGSVGLDSRTREGLAGSINLVGGPLKGRVNQSLKIDLSVTNVGDATWLADGEDGIGVVYLGAHRSGRDGNLIDRDIARARVPRAVGPGETIEISLILNPPDRGVGRLDLNLVSEKITWFATAGDRRHRTVSVSVEIE